MAVVSVFLVLTLLLQQISVKPCTFYGCQGFSLSVFLELRSWFDTRERFC